MRTETLPRKRKAAGTQAITLAELSPLLDGQLEKWPAEILIGQRYVVDMDTDDAQFIHNVFGRTARRWQIEVAVRIIDEGVLFLFSGRPQRRK